MSTLRRILSERWRRFWNLLDSERVVLDQMLFYAFISLAGLYNLIATTPIQALEETMSPAYYTFFCWLCFLGPIVTMIGRALKGRLTYAGLWLCLAGDVSVELVFWIYITAIVSTSWWGKGTFAAFIAIACLVGTNFFILRDVRQLTRVEKVARIFDEGER